MKSLSKALLAAVIIATPAAAHGDEELAPPVVFRHQGMQIVVNSAMGAMSVLKGEAGSDENLVPLAEALVAGAKVSQSAFKVDTRTVHGKGEAKDQIWAEWDKFSAAMDGFVADTEAFLAAAKTGDKSASMAALGKTFKNCKSCHDVYKEK
ncbi:c-type cytochrome [Pseudokordiimonas caeni]|uniref:c-type cytochrome n=1 Tax=Pseudokordiimonas caeni TaxID=2997908 RepID=UPI002812479C|nr:cytochrome c [Pseudokordiimonas caeni]